MGKEEPPRDYPKLYTTFPHNAARHFPFHRLRRAGDFTFRRPSVPRPAR